MAYHESPFFIWLIMTYHSVSIITIIVSSSNISTVSCIHICACNVNDRTALAQPLPVATWMMAGCERDHGRDHDGGTFGIRFFMPLLFMSQFAVAAPGLFMPLWVVLQVQISMQFTVSIMLLNHVLSITWIIIVSVKIGIGLRSVWLKFLAPPLISEYPD